MEKRLHKKLSLKLKQLKAPFWGTIEVAMDTQEEHWLESMPAGTESCPYWYSVRLFKGVEVSPAINKEPEYWLGICNVFLAPILPIPIIGEEVVIKLGDNLGLYHELKNMYGSHFAHNIMMNKDKHFNKIIDKATVKFKNCDIKYNNDEIWSVY